MEIIKNKMHIYLTVALITISCSQYNSSCKEKLCLYSRILYKEDRMYVELGFNSNIKSDSIKIVFDNKAFSLECPLYQEDQKLFIGKVPRIEDLKFSQLVIENEKGNFRVYSSKRFYGIEEVRVLEEVNCALYEVDQVTFSVENKQYIKTVLIDDIRDLQIEDTDDKIKLHYYFKPTYEMEHAGYKSLVISSTNWIKM